MDKTTQTDTNHIYKKYEEIVIYVLECENEKYYVGKTNDFTVRMKSHKLGKGSFWTRKYPMINIIEIIRNADKFDEDKYVLKYMDKYGVDNVRGGSYSQMILSQELKNCIQRHMVTANNLCYICGKGDHLIRECELNPKNPKFLNKPKNNSETETETEKETKTKTEEKDNNLEPDNKKQLLNQNVVCIRCERTGHYKEQCFSKRHINGTKL
jgi:hypothetical protein